MNDLESALLQLAHDINDGDETAQAEADRILNGISDARLVPALVPLLGDYRPAAGIRLCDLAAILMRRLGQSELVEAFNHTLESSTEGLMTLRTCALRGQVIEALMRALESNCSLLITWV